MRSEKIVTRNAEFQRFETLKRNREKRTRQGLAFLEGVQMVEQAVSHGWQFYAMAVADGVRLSGWAEDMIGKARPETLYRMDRELHSSLSDRDEPCEIIGLIRMRTDGLSRMSRQALECAADFYDPQCIRASVGTVFALPFGELPGAEEAAQWLRAQPCRPLIVGTSARGTKNISDIDLTGSVALVIGNETFGLSRAWKEKCDVLARIPICGAASSLNAGSAATVCFYEISRQRLEKGLPPR